MRRSLGAVVCVGLVHVAVACGESTRATSPAASGAGGGEGARGGSSGALGGGGRPDVGAGGSLTGGGTGAGEGGAEQLGAGGGANASAGGAAQQGGAGGRAGGSFAGSSGAPNGGALDGGFAGDGDAGAAPVGGFAADFTPRARAALQAVAPEWTCATTLPNVPVADTEAARGIIRAFIAEAFGVAPADLTMTVQECDTPTTASCATTFAFFTAASGGSIYDTSAPLAEELEANATAVEVTSWVPMKDGVSFSSVYVMSGIADGVLVGMVLFNAPDVCQ